MFLNYKQELFMPRFFNFYIQTLIFLKALIVAFFILAVFLIYQACLFHVKLNPKSFRIYMVDFDGRVEL